MYEYNACAVVYGPYFMWQLLSLPAAAVLYGWVIS